MINKDNKQQLENSSIGSWVGYNTKSDVDALFSTNEQRYSSLLGYKLSKFGFSAQYRDLFVEGNRN